MAVPANPEGREVAQPDGAKFTVHLRGDEFFSWQETADGYVVVKDAADGFWKYAQPAADRAAFVAIPEARVGTVDPVRLGLSRHARPPADLVRAQIEERQRELLGEPEELPVPEARVDQDFEKTGK